jgi:hypothetical protein
MATQKLYPEVPWIEIDKVPESVVAERFRTYSMFFAAQHLEGCPLTALEAMACGCLVAGFPGTENFTHPYAKEGNGYWAKDNDVDSAIRCVANMIEDSRSNPGKVKAIQESGIHTSQNYSKQAVSQALKRFVAGLEFGVVGTERADDRKMIPPVSQEQWVWSDSARKKLRSQRTSVPSVCMPAAQDLIRTPAPLRASADRPGMWRIATKMGIGSDSGTTQPMIGAPEPDSTGTSDEP